jgi:hypothetical protein
MACGTAASDAVADSDYEEKAVKTHSVYSLRRIV